MNDVDDMTIYHSSRQVGVTSCYHDNGGCEHFCFSLPKGGHVCACAEHYLLQRDNRSCSREYSISYLLIKETLVGGGHILSWLFYGVPEILLCWCSELLILNWIRETCRIILFLYFSFLLLTCIFVAFQLPWIFYFWARPLSSQESSFKCREAIKQWYLEEPGSVPGHANTQRNRALMQR